MAELTPEHLMLLGKIEERTVIMANDLTDIKATMKENALCCKDCREQIDKRLTKLENESDNSAVIGDWKTQLLSKSTSLIIASAALIGLILDFIWNHLHLWV